MAFTKITNSELNSRGATTLPNQPTISAAALKQEFDAPAKEIVAPKFNNLIDELEAETAAANIGIETPTGRIGETIQEVLNDVSTDLKNVEDKVEDINHSELEDAILKRHSHENKNVLDEFSVSAQGNLLWDGIPVGGGGSNYENLENKPQINGYQLIGNKSASDLDLASAGDVSSLASAVGSMSSDLGIAQSRIRNLQEVTTQLSNDKADKSDLGTASSKNSTSVVTDSTDLVESGAVENIIGWGNKNLWGKTLDEIKALNVGSGTWSGNTVTWRGITLAFTIEDGYVSTIAVSGTSKDEVNYNLGNITEAGKYIVNGCPANGSNSTYNLRTEVDGNFIPDNYDNGEGSPELTVSTSLGIRIIIRNGQTVNLVYKPMIRNANVTDATYEPHHASVSDSLEEKADNSVIGTVENNATASQAYAVGEHFIRDGAFCTCTQAIAQGGTFTLNTNYTAGDVADFLMLNYKTKYLTLADIIARIPNLYNMLIGFVDGEVIKVLTNNAISYGGKIVFTNIDGVSIDWFGMIGSSKLGSGRITVGGAYVTHTIYAGD